jgi:hypothetical protein
MTLRRIGQAAGYAAFGFFCDLASTGYTRSVVKDQPWLAIGCNFILMLITWKIFLTIKGRLLFASWIIGQSAGIYLAMHL